MLAPGEILVLDNLSARKATGMQQALAGRRARRLYLPPYSSDWSPRERCVSKLKTALGAESQHAKDP
jgi:transposase